MSKEHFNPKILDGIVREALEKAKAEEAKRAEASGVKKPVKTPEVKFRCNLCNQEFIGSHICRNLREKGYLEPVSPSSSNTSQDNSSFFTSFMVGHFTGSAPLGYIAGGNLSGSIIGSMTSEPSRAPDQSAHSAPHSFESTSNKY